MIKAKFGDSIRSKTDTAMVNEALCKVLCHNICCLIQSMFELGIEATFWVEAEMVKTKPTEAVGRGSSGPVRHVCLDVNIHLETGHGPGGMPSTDQRWLVDLGVGLR